MNNPHRPLPLHKKEARKNVYKEGDKRRANEESSLYDDHEEKEYQKPFVETSLFIRAVHALRKEDRHTQLFYSFFVSGIFSFCIMLLWLHYAYGFFQSDTSIYEEKVLVGENSMQGKEHNIINEHFNDTPFSFFAEEVRKRFSQMTIPTSFSKIPRELFDNTKVYESK